MQLKRFFQIIVAGSLLTSPAIAADPNRLFLNHAERGRPTGYFGATISIARHSNQHSGPALRLGIGVRPHMIADDGRSFGNALIELDPAAAKGARLYIGGRRLTAAEGEAGLNTGTILLAVAAAAGAIFLVSHLADSGDDDEELCFIPEGCE